MGSGVRRCSFVVRRCLLIGTHAILFRFKYRSCQEDEGRNWGRRQPLSHCKHGLKCCLKKVENTLHSTAVNMSKSDTNIGHSESV
jgi:hypothetical protein